MLSDATSLPFARSWPPSRLAQATPATCWMSPRPVGQAMAAGLGPQAVGVRVYVNEGRWVVDCPDCHGAQLAAREDRRFMCNECANVAVDGLWRPVLWPSNAADIEAALGKRPPRNAHWRAPETVADLLAENKVMGVS